MNYTKMTGLFMLGFTGSLFFLFSFAQSPKSDGRFYEMRIYYAEPGKLEDLNKRFRDHTVRLFEKHGMKNIGYWEPIENPENKLVYILSYPDRESREKSWQGFLNDPEWKKAHAASEQNGKLVTKIENIFMNTTDFSPKLKNGGSGSGVYEMRTYITEPGKMGDLLSRFRNHTVKLFAKHGMKNIGYWKPVDGEEGAENTLIYLLGHDSKESGERSFASFRNDPKWIAAKDASEAAGPIVQKVISVYMKPTDYSPMK